MTRIGPKWLIAIAYVMGLFMEILDMTVLNTALPTIGREFGVADSALQYVLTGYLVSLALFVPASGWVADRFGTKWTFAFAIAVFTAASALAGMAQSMELLIAARVLQGVGGGMLTPVGTAMLYRAFPADERARATSVLSVPVLIAPALGPVLGGWLTDTMSWRSIFYLNLPIGIAALLFTLLVVPNQRTTTQRRFDLSGFLLGGAGVAALLVGLERAPTYSWQEQTTLLLTIGGAILLALFAVVELRVREPLLDLRLLRNRNFAAGNLIALVSTGAMMGILFLAPLLLQQVMGLDATTSGLVTVAQVVGMSLVTPFLARLYSWLGARRMMGAGFALLAAAILALSQLDPTTPLWGFRGVLGVVGVALALIMVPSQTATFETIPAPNMTSASSLFSTVRQIASAVGVAVMSTILTARIAANQAQISPAASAGAKTEAVFAAYDQTFVISAAIAVLGFLMVRAFRSGTEAASPSPDRAIAAGARTAASTAPGD